jgi:hypothetical protein
MQRGQTPSGFKYHRVSTSGFEVRLPMFQVHSGASSLVHTASLHPPFLRTYLPSITDIRSDFTHSCLIPLTMQHVHSPTLVCPNCLCKRHAIEKLRAEDDARIAHKLVDIGFSFEPEE